MEPEDTLPHSQVHATCSYAQRDKSSPRPHPTSQTSILILSSHLRLGLLSGLFPSIPKTLRCVNPLNAELNPICHLLALLEVHHFLHVRRIRVNTQNFEFWTHMLRVTATLNLLAQEFYT
jgi:hypothetical protein